MPDLQAGDRFKADDFTKKLFNGKDLDEASPKMSEYIEMMEAYLLIREKSVFEKGTLKDLALD